MGECILYGNGGSNPLNFKVVGGTSAPSNPKENTIWVNTSTAITSYVFSPNQPTGSAGMVWIALGTSSTVSFNALKKNNITFFIITAKQFVSGAWVDKTAKCYQNGNWKVPSSELYIVKAGVPAYTFYVSSGNSVKQYDTYYAVTGTKSGHHAAWVVDIDLTPYKTLTIDGTFRVDDGFELCVWEKANSEPDWEDHIATANLTTTGAALDVSGLSGLYSVGIANVYTHTMKIENLWLK